MTPEQRARELYAKGVQDGMETTLTLLLGRDAGGGVPYQGNLNQSAREWAEAALARIQGGDRDS